MRRLREGGITIQADFPKTEECVQEHENAYKRFNTSAAVAITADLVSIIFPVITPVGLTASSQFIGSALEVKRTHDKLEKVRTEEFGEYLKGGR